MYKMPLTRSLYREDELIAALKWCIIKGRFKETLFWSQEALDSNMKDDFLKALLWVWIFTCGPASISWMERFETCMQNPTESSCLNLAISLIYHVKFRGDGSTLALLGVGLCKRKKQPNTITLFTVPHTLPDTPIIRALVQGKVDLAWTLLRPDWSTNAWATLNNVIKVKHPTHVKHIQMLMEPAAWMGSAYKPEYTWCLRALATVLTCNSVAYKISEEPAVFDRVLADYISHTGLSMRTRRIYEIPYACLYWFTQRGSKKVNETTECELQMNLEDTLVGSKFWTTYLPIGYDLAREEFFYIHFPDDIPDEWSTESRMKSHGYGGVPVGNVNHSVMFNNCLIRWFGAVPCKSVWRGFELALEEFSQRWSVNRPDTLEAGIHEAYEEIDVNTWIHEMESWSLTSKKRKFVVV